MHTSEMTDNDKRLHNAARAGNDRTAALHAALCGGAAQAEAAQQQAGNTESPFAPPVPYWKESPAPRPTANSDAERAEPLFAPTVPYWKESPAPR